MEGYLIASDAWGLRKRSIFHVNIDRMSRARRVEGIATAWYGREITDPLGD